MKPKPHFRRAFLPLVWVTVTVSCGMCHATANINDTTHCPNCPGFPTSGPSCPANGKPTLVYPPDGVLLPPNMNVLEIQFLPGAGNSVFEIAFRNSVTDVKVELPCNKISNIRGADTGGCSYDVDQTIWNALAQANRGGDPITVTVNATPQNASCVGVSDPRTLSLAEEDINGGLYYWQSAVYQGAAGRTGGIFRYDFGVPGKTGTPYLTPSSLSQYRCVGCHFLSRDGLRMTISNDDPDSDDEYGDIKTELIEVSSKSMLGSPFDPGSQAFTHNHSRVISSDGLANNNSTGTDAFNLLDGNSGAVMAPVPSGQRGTEPDWAPDDSSVVFVSANFQFDSHFGDDHFTGGSLFTMSYSSGSGSFGPPRPLLQSSGNDNYYYPSYSPDGQFVIFDRASQPDISGQVDAFNNPDATIVVVPAAGGSPVELAKLNKGAGLTNSWPRWSPFIQNYQGKKLLWVTFSSTRDYGVRVQNENQNLVQCYPPDTPQNPCPLGVNCHGTPLAPNCNQPQIWMGAVIVEQSELGQGLDTSFAAFWLPFQDVTSHNHIAQWTQQVVPTTGEDAGVGNCSSGCGTDGGLPDGFYLN